MKAFVAMLALAMGLVFGAATFAVADEKAAPAPAPTAPAEKKDAPKAEKKDAKKTEKKGK